MIALLIATTSAYASWCTEGYRWDSYQIGRCAELNQCLGKPELLDEGCFRLGKRDGKKLMEEEKCGADQLDAGFNAGYAQKKRASLTDPCFDAAYEAGTAALDSDARQDYTPVGTTCLVAYGRGKKDAEDHLVATIPSDDRDARCYRVGYFDGVLFGE